MFKKIVLLFLCIGVALYAKDVKLQTKLQDVNAKQLVELHKNGVPIIDIRTPREWERTGIIEGSSKIMFFDKNGKYDVDKFMSEFTKVVKDKNQSFILVCRSANRTKTVGNFLINDMNYTNVKELAGGIKNGWIGMGLKTVK